MFRIVKFFEEVKSGTKTRTKIDQRFKTIEEAREWIKKDVSPYLNEQGYEEFDRDLDEDMWIDYVKTYPKNCDEKDYGHYEINWLSYLIKGYEGEQKY